jgi:hypothetical protein
MAAAIGLVVVSLIRLDLVNRIAAGQTVSLDDASASDALVSNVARVSGGVYLLTAIAVLLWLHRVVQNNQILGERYLRFSPAFAVGCWFIPFANLVLPFRAVREAWGLRIRTFRTPHPTPDAGHGAAGSLSPGGRRSLPATWSGLRALVSARTPASTPLRAFALSPTSPACRRRCTWSPW